MSIFTITNIPAMRSIFQFNRISIDIAETLRRLETGQRIITGKDDPSGLITRELMRTDIKGIQTAQKNTMMANELLSMADSGLANISRMLLGDINQRDDTGLLGMIYDDTLPTEMKRQQIHDILNMIDSTIRASTYNGQQILNGSMGYQLSGVQSCYLSKVSVSSAQFGTAKGLPVTISVLEQARQGGLQFSANDLDRSNAFDLHLTGVSGNTTTISLAAGADNATILAEVNAKTEETGVQARQYGTTLIFETLEAGSTQSLSLAVQDSTNADLVTVTDMAGNATNTDTGKDIRAKVNGHEVVGRGQQIEYSSPELTMSATIAPSMKVGERTQFNVAGGMLFQLGKDVQTSSQYRMVLPNMMVSHLGGASGTLDELRKIDLDTDAGKAKAYSIINEAVNMVATQRGKIGAVQKHVLDANANNLDFQLEKVSEAEALISNTDMALESSRLNRAELLAQSAMSSILYSQSFRQFVLNALL